MLISEGFLIFRVRPDTTIFQKPEPHLAQKPGSGNSANKNEHLSLTGMKQPFWQSSTLTMYLNMKFSRTSGNNKIRFWGLARLYYGLLQINKFDQSAQVEIATSNL